MTGFKILSPYNPSIVLFDGRHLSKEDCDRVSMFLKDGREAYADKNILLVEERKKFSDQIKFHDRLREKYLAELCMLKSKYKEQKKINAELVGTIEDLDAGKADLSHALEEKELVLAGSKRKYAELEEDMTQKRLESEDTILDQLDTIDTLQERVSDLEERNEYLQDRIQDFQIALADSKRKVYAELEKDEGKAEANVINNCIIS